MGRTLRRSILGVFVAIAVTTTMDATGLSEFSALPLFPLMVIFGYIERLSRQSMGFAWGRWSDCGLAMLYPVAVLGLCALVSAAASAVDLSQTDWEKVWLKFALVTTSTFLVAILTEEGFFRGWFWASLERAGETKPRVLVWSSIGFSLWHLSAVTLSTDFELPSSHIPVFMVNAGVMGAIWGLLRWISGSVIVASLSHGVWNGIAYVFFGFGTKTGALGIADTAIYGPEVGVLGLILNVMFAAALWQWWKARASHAA